MKNVSKYNTKRSKSIEQYDSCMYTYYVRRKNEIMKTRKQANLEKDLILEIV